jgi:hypothetical protein
MRKLIALALLTSTAAAQAALGSSFDFSGYVTSSNDAGVAVGAALSGTLAYNPGNGFFCCGEQIGSPSGWTIENFGDLDTSSISISTGSYQYTTDEQGPLGFPSETGGEIVGSSNGLFIEDLVNYGESFGDWIQINTPPGSAPPFASDGDPILATDATATGLVGDPFGNVIQFDVTSLQPSLQPVPLPSTVWLLLSALGALGLVKKSHRRNLNDVGAKAAATPHG